MVSIIVAVAYPIVLSADVLNEYMLLCICDISVKLSSISTPSLRCICKFQDQCMRPGSLALYDFLFGQTRCSYHFFLFLQFLFILHDLFDLYNYFSHFIVTFR